jgi:pimeloyl-ACP methyl ester carboxylesterase
MLKFILYFLLLNILFANTKSCSIGVNEAETSSSNTIPVIFVSGYGSKSSLWKDTGFVDYLSANSERELAGTLQTKNGALQFEDSIDGGNMFIHVFSDSTAGVATLSEELKESIDFVITRTSSEKICLVAYSMGGIVARDYLVKNLDSHNVHSLVTVASPHQGTWLANIPYAVGVLFGDKIFNELGKQLESSTNIPINIRAISDLIQGADGYITELNREKHPTDVAYYSIVASIDGIFMSKADCSEMLTTSVCDFILNTDGVCKEEAQDMKASIFSSDDNYSTYYKRISNTHHLSVLEQHGEIFDVLKDAWE